MSHDPFTSQSNAASCLRPLPKYRLHKASGQGVATIGGKDFYFGPYGTKASKAEYDRRCAEWLAAKRPTYTAASALGLTVNELILRFWKHAATYYPPETLNGTLKPPLRRLRVLYPSAECRPLRDSSWTCPCMDSPSLRERRSEAIVDARADSCASGRLMVVSGHAPIGALSTFPRVPRRVEPALSYQTASYQHKPTRASACEGVSCSPVAMRTTGHIPIVRSARTWLDLASIRRMLQAAPMTSVSRAYQSGPSSGQGTLLGISTDGNFW